MKNNSFIFSKIYCKNKGRNRFLIDEAKINFFAQRNSKKLAPKLLTNIDISNAKIHLGDPKTSLQEIGNFIDFLVSQSSEIISNFLIKNSKISVNSPAGLLQGDLNFAYSFRPFVENDLFRHNTYFRILPKINNQSIDCNISGYLSADDLNPFLINKSMGKIWVSNTSLSNFLPFSEINFFQKKTRANKKIVCAKIKRWNSNIKTIFSITKNLCVKKCPFKYYHLFPNLFEKTKKTGFFRYLLKNSNIQTIHSYLLPNQKIVIKGIFDRFNFVLTISPTKERNLTLAIFEKNDKILFLKNTGSFNKPNFIGTYKPYAIEKIVGIFQKRSPKDIIHAFNFKISESFPKQVFFHSFFQKNSVYKKFISMFFETYSNPINNQYGLSNFRFSYRNWNLKIPAIIVQSKTKSVVGKAEFPENNFANDFCKANFSGSLNFSYNDTEKILIDSSIVINELALKLDSKIFESKPAYNPSDIWPLKLFGMPANLLCRIKTKPDINFLINNKKCELEADLKIATPISAANPISLAVATGYAHFSGKNVMFENLIIDDINAKLLYQFTPLVDPIFESTLQTYAKKHHISFYLFGIKDDFIVSTESKPHLSDEQIFSLLLTGASDHNASSKFFLSGALAKLGSIISMKYNKSPIKKMVSKFMTPASYLKFGPSMPNSTEGFAPIAASVMIDLGDNLSATIEKDFSRTDDLRLNLEYLLSENLTMKVHRSLSGAVQGAVEMRFKF